MNFIDWNNEWSSVYNQEYDMQNPDPNSKKFKYKKEPSPIPGMSVEVF